MHLRVQDLIDKLYEACSDQEQTKLAGQTFVWNTDAAPVVRRRSPLHMVAHATGVAQCFIRLCESFIRDARSLFRVAALNVAVLP